MVDGSAMRVRWIHTCPMPHDCGYDRGGTVWQPDISPALRDLDDWQIAVGLGLTVDSRPDPDRQFAMVAWDCRPGLQVHYWDELEEVDDVPKPVHPHDH